MKFNHWQRIYPENNKYKIIILAEKTSGSISFKVKEYYQREKKSLIIIIKWSFHQGDNHYK